MTCPECKSHDVMRSRRRGFKEKVFLRLTREAPYRCQKCKARFISYQTRREPRVDRIRRRRDLVFLFIAILLSIGVAIAVVEWNNRPATSQPTE